MARRGYRQYCTVAHALDLVGERWTLLILRDLLPGPLRFSDLRDKQPGLATDLLTSRLRALEANALIRRRRLDPPAGSMVYELLDPKGTTRDVLESLVRFGAPFMPPYSATEGHLDIGWALTSIASYLGSRTPDGAGLVAETDTGTVHLRKKDNRAVLNYGVVGEPTLRVVGRTSAVLGLIMSRTKPSESEVEIRGASSELAAWLEAIRETAPRPLVANAQGER